MKHSLESRLITDYLNGDEESLEVLIKQYLKPVYGFVYKYTGDVQEAEDITQEVFVKLWKNLKKFDRQKSFKTWIFSIAKNASIDYLRKKKPILFSQFENEKQENRLVNSLADSNPLPDEVFDKKKISEVINATMEKLALKYRLVISLRYNEQFTFREIAEILDEPINTIKSRHRRALRLLKNLLPVLK